MNKVFHHSGLMLLLGIGLLVWSFSPSSQRLDQQFYNHVSGLLPEIEIPPSTVIISLPELGSSGTVSHATLTRVLDHLRSLSVSAIGVTIPLTSRQSLVDAESISQLQSLNNSGAYDALLEKLDPDATLISRLTGARNVVIAAPTNLNFTSGMSVVTADTADDIQRWLMPLMSAPHDNVVTATPPLNEFLINTPLAPMVENTGYDTVSGISIIDDSGSQSLASFVARISTLALAINPELIKRVPGKGVTLGFLDIPVDAGYKLYPRLPKPYTAIPVYSAEKILSGELSSLLLSNRVVLLAVGSGLEPVFAAPDGRMLSPVAWQAHAINALIAYSSGGRAQSKSLVEPRFWGQGLQRALLVLVVIYFLLLPVRLYAWPGLIVGVVITLLMMNASVLLLILKNIWLPLILPTAFLIVGHALLWYWQRRQSVQLVVRQQRDKACLELAVNLRGQGQLDKAVDCLQYCDPDENILAERYELGLEFERRRQFTRAMAIYQQILATRSRYRDVPERLARQQQATGTPNLAATTIASKSTGSSLVVDDPQVARPVLGRYEVERELGRGAMGTVYLGRDPRIGRTVAIKTLALSEEFESTQLEDVRRRFFQEAETAGRLSHSDIVTIYDVGEEHDLAYIAMDYIQGESLDEHIHPERLLPIAEVFAIGVRVARALDYAHAQKVVHRDVKPGNIMYDSGAGQLKVTDFGIAHLSDNSKTRTGTVLGSPYYMSPEQIAGKKVDGRSDLFSLGVSLYQLFTGHLPFAGDSLTTLMYQITHEKPKAIRKLRPELPTCLTRIINKALDKRITGRYASGESMAEALQRCAQQSGYA